MEIIVHQLLCGELNKAWDLLKSTISDNSTARSIAFKSDLQDQTPTGVTWTPVIRGFLFQDYFLLIKTYPDTSEYVRHGRVFSHVLAIRKCDLKFLEGINSLINSFPQSLDKTIEIEPIRILASKGFDNLEQTADARFSKVIHGFTELQNYKNTIIWVGQELYEDAVCKFWQMLSEEDKDSVNFGINFNASQIRDDKINFLVIPESLESKFLNQGYCVVRKNDKHVLATFFEQYLAGDVQSHQKIDDFRKAVEINELTRMQIEKVAKVIDTFNNFEQLTDFKKINTLSHIVGEYSPDPNKGKTFKAKIVDKIESLIKVSGHKEIELLKNFRTKPFLHSETKLSNAINSWVEENLFSVSKNVESDYSDLIIRTYKAVEENWWVVFLQKKIKKFLSDISSISAQLFIHWSKSKPEVFLYLKNDLEHSHKSENLLISSLNTDNAEPLFTLGKAFAIERKWYKLHSSILVREYSFERAITEQLKVDTDSNYSEGISIITQTAEAKKVIDFTVRNGDSRLIRISGRLCCNNLNLLKGIDIENLNWQNILLEVFKDNVGIHNLDEVEVLIDSFYGLMIESKPYNEELLQIISTTKFANILTYNKRDILWSCIPSEMRMNFMQKTGAALLENLSHDSNFEIPDDETLINYLLTSNVITTFLYYNRANISSVLSLFYKINSVPERLLKDYIDSYNSKIDIVEATQLGKLVYSRRFVSVANSIYYKCSYNGNFKYALIECHSLLDFYTKGKIILKGILSNVQVTHEQWINAFTEIAIKLYPNPMHNKIWVQAGGEEYDLSTRGTGKEVWIDAISRLMRNEFKKITIAKLLKQMIKEHPKNENLITLSDLLLTI